MSKKALCIAERLFGLSLYAGGSRWAGGLTASPSLDPPLVEATGFEPTTAWLQTRCSTN